MWIAGWISVVFCGEFVSQTYPYRGHCFKISRKKQASLSVLVVMLSVNTRVQSTLCLSSLKTKVSSSEKQEWINMNDCFVARPRVTKSRAGGSAHWKKPYMLRTCPMLLHNSFFCIRSLHTCLQYWTIKMNQIPREERHKNSVRIANNLFYLLWNETKVLFS